MVIAGADFCALRSYLGFERPRLQPRCSAKIHPRSGILFVMQQRWNIHHQPRSGGIVKPSSGRVCVRTQKSKGRFCPAEPSEILDIRPCGKSPHSSPFRGEIVKPRTAVLGRQQEARSSPGGTARTNVCRTIGADSESGAKIAHPRSGGIVKPSTGSAGSAEREQHESALADVIRTV